jgi:hypothetical protein
MCLDCPPSLLIKSDEQPRAAPNEPKFGKAVGARRSATTLARDGVLHTPFKVSTLAR